MIKVKKRKLSSMLEELEMSLADAAKLARDKLSADMMTRAGYGVDMWLTIEAQAIMREAAFIPELVPKHYRAVVKSLARNNRLVLAHSKEIGKMVPVVMPKRYIKGMVGKMILIEEIEDDKGKSWRYVS